MASGAIAPRPAVADVVSLCDSSLLELADELILHIFAFLDIPELLSSSRTCHRLWAISNDRRLHRDRLLQASRRLDVWLLLRPPLSAIHPPKSTIYQTPTHRAASHLGRRLVSIRLNRSLSRRPNPGELVTSNILPRECCTQDPMTGRVVMGYGGVAPSIVGAKRKVERERVKDRLRGWLSASWGAWKGRKYAEEHGWIAGAEAPPYSAESKVDVRRLIRRFARLNPAGLDSRDVRRSRPMPTRAHVRQLRSFWERFARERSV